MEYFVNLYIKNVLRGDFAAMACRTVCLLRLRELNYELLLNIFHLAWSTSLKTFRKYSVISVDGSTFIRFEGELVDQRKVNWTYITGQLAAINFNSDSLFFSNIKSILCKRAVKFNLSLTYTTPCRNICSARTDILFSCFVFLHIEFNFCLIGTIPTFQGVFDLSFLLILSNV